MFEKITSANWTMFAMKHYVNPQDGGEEEFYEDIKRFNYGFYVIKGSPINFVEGD